MFRDFSLCAYRYVTHNVARVAISVLWVVCLDWDFIQRLDHQRRARADGRRNLTVAIRRNTPVEDLQVNGTQHRGFPSAYLYSHSGVRTKTRDDMIAALLWA